MKQKTALVLAMVYLAGMSGFAFDMHYCGGKLAAIALFNLTPQCKMCTQMTAVKQHNTCCKDAKIEVKVKDNHQVSDNLVLQKLFTVILNDRVEGTSPVSLAYAPEITYDLNKAPPGSGQPPLNILHCTFRI